MMGLARSTFYEIPKHSADDTAIVEAMAAICDEFEHYGWRRVRAALRQQGLVVNHKKIRRLMANTISNQRFAAASAPQIPALRARPSTRICSRDGI